MGRLRRLRPLRIAAAILFLFAAQFAAPAVHADDYSQNAVITTSDLDNQFGICNGSYGSPDAGMAGCASDYPWCNSVGTGGGNAPGDCHPTSGTIWWHYLSGWTAGTFENRNLDNDRQVWTSTVSYCGVSVGGGSCTPNETYNNSTYVYANCPVGQIGASFQDSFGAPRTT